MDIPDHPGPPVSRRRFLTIAAGTGAAIAGLPLLQAAAGAAPAAGPRSPGATQAEFTPQPLGIDTRVPRLSWQLSSEERGVVQSAYQILVATSDDALAHDRGDLWDSGRVSSPSRWGSSTAGCRCGPGNDASGRSGRGISTVTALAGAHRTGGRRACSRPTTGRRAG